jgi:hypothetical protein
MHRASYVNTNQDDELSTSNYGNHYYFVVEQYELSPLYHILEEF